MKVEVRSFPLNASSHEMCTLNSADDYGSIQKSSELKGFMPIIVGCKLSNGQCCYTPIYCMARFNAQGCTNIAKPIIL